MDVIKNGIGLGLLFTIILIFIIHIMRIYTDFADFIGRGILSLFCRRKS